MTTIEQQAALDFVLTMRRRWADTLFPVLSAQAEENLHVPDDQFAEALHATPAWPWFAWMERGSQKMLWRAVGDAVAEEGRPSDTGGLPDWYTDWDIHLQPGGIWSSAKAARVYELGARLVMLGENDDYRFHRLFADTAVPKRAYRRIVDLGCGFGKSAWPLKQAFPEAEVIGIDLARPCLDLARQRCAERQLDVTFIAADACATGLADGCADLVTSTMLIHEMPGDALAALYREAARLLAPGGSLRFLDFQHRGDRLRDRMIDEHGDRNNEPFLPPMLAQDQTALARDAGFATARWRAFDERGGGTQPTLEWPDRPEWHFPWAVLEAEMAA
ncbi:class I SAM-dependent methyltransferase [Polymorphobacter sp.]|uniref:class I SAM-dependent methyltransferase n=1 Tax=Polymorphobacter sp. TaxID=1909290 RepID=UPI003F730ADA